MMHGSPESAILARSLRHRGQAAYPRPSRKTSSRVRGDAHPDTPFGSSNVLQWTPERQVPLRPVLRLWEPDHFVLPIDIRPLHVEHFAQPTATMESDHEEGFQARRESVEDRDVIVVFQEALPRVLHTDDGNV